MTEQIKPSTEPVKAKIWGGALTPEEQLKLVTNNLADIDNLPEDVLSVIKQIGKKLSRLGAESATKVHISPHTNEVSRQAKNGSR